MIWWLDINLNIYVTSLRYQLGSKAVAFYLLRIDGFMVSQ